MAAKKLVIKLTAKQAKGIQEALGISAPCRFLQIPLPEDPADVAGMAAGDSVAVYMPPPRALLEDTKGSVWLL